MIKLHNNTLKRIEINQLLKENNLPYFVDIGKRSIRWWQRYSEVKEKENSGYLISKNQVLNNIELRQPEIVQKIKDIINS